MEVCIPCRLDDAVEQGLRGGLTICHQHGVQAVVRALDLRSRRDEGGVRLTVGVNQQHTRIRCASSAQHPGDA